MGKTVSRLGELKDGLRASALHMQLNVKSQTLRGKVFWSRPGLVFEMGSLSKQKMGRRCGVEGGQEKASAF